MTDPGDGWDQFQPVFICGGDGRRLALSHRDRLPKCLLPAGGRPILGWLMDRFICPGVRPIFVHAADSGDVPRYVRDYGVPGPIFVGQERPDGVANAVHLALPYLDREALVVLGDLVLIGSFQLPIPALPTIGVWNDAPADATRAGYGVALREGLAAELIEKPSSADGLECGMGVYLLPTEMVDRFPDTPINHSTGEREITAAVDFAARAVGKPLSIIRFEGIYINVNTPDDLRLAAQRLAQFSP